MTARQDQSVNKNVPTPELVESMNANLLLSVQNKLEVSTRNEKAPARTSQNHSCQGRHSAHREGLGQGRLANNLPTSAHMDFKLLTFQHSSPRGFP